MLLLLFNSSIKIDKMYKNTGFSRYGKKKIIIYVFNCVSFSVWMIIHFTKTLRAATIKKKNHLNLCTYTNRAYYNKHYYYYFKRFLNKKTSCQLYKENEEIDRYNTPIVWVILINEKQCI